MTTRFRRPSTLIDGLSTGDGGGGGGGAGGSVTITRVALGTLDLTDNSITVWPLTEAIVEGNIYEWEAWGGSGTTANMYGSEDVQW